MLSCMSTQSCLPLLCIHSYHLFFTLTNKWSVFSVRLVLSRFRAQQARSQEDSSPAGQAPGLRLTGQMGRHDPLWAVGSSRITHESMLKAYLIASNAGPVTGMQVDVPCTAQPMRAPAYTIRPPDSGRISAGPKP